jgi:hypothetical protein
VPLSDPIPNYQFRSLLAKIVKDRFDRMAPKDKSDDEREAQMPRRRNVSSSVPANCKCAFCKKKNGEREIAGLISIFGLTWGIHCLV